MKRSVMSLPRCAIPKMALVKQRLRSEHIENVRKETCAKLLARGLGSRIGKGSRVAVTAGSRGLGGFIELLNGICDAIRQVGGEPFIVPSMGSHGGATPEGQTEILRRLGVNEKAVPAAIQATMETLPLGSSRTGAVAHLDKAAQEADGIIVLGRVKTHPQNTQGIASGLLKMTTVGLGKQIGAQEAHSHGLWESVRAVPEVTLGKAKVLFGVAVVENAFRQPVVIEVVPGNYQAFREADTRLLDIAKQHFARIPAQQLDLLIVDELGKNISGTGMDLNVIGSWRVKGGKPDPDFRRIVALSLTRESLGNGLGIGLADFTTERMMNEYDPAVTYVNLLTATEPGGNTREGPLPLALPSDREAIEVALHSALPAEAPRACRIRNTALLEELWVSEPVLKELRAQSDISITQEPEEVRFDKEGNLF